MGKTKANRKRWRKKGFEKLGTRSLADVAKTERSEVLRGILGISRKQKKKKSADRGGKTVPEREVDMLADLYY